MQTSYSVQITNATAAAPGNGFIDPTTIEAYMAANSLPATYAQCQAKERGNVRFDFLQQQVQLEANVYMTNLTASGASATAEATSFSFTAVVERGDDVLVTRDESNPGSYLTGTAALKRWVARALVESRTCFGDIYDPTLATTPGNTTTAARYGIRTEQITVGALKTTLTAAEALITVTAL